MAWQAKLSRPVETSEDRVVAVFDFYDDVDPNTILASQTFVFDPAWSNVDMRNAIQAAGARLRTAYTKANTLAQNFPTGTVISIP